MDISTLKRQHSEVMTLASFILDQIKNHTVEKNLDEIVKNINTISGKLKLHLLNEDNYLYPHLINHADATISQFGKKYSAEMKGVTKVFEDYKSSYNTSNKIKDNIGQFEAATKQVFAALSNRIEREEKELYPLLG